MAETVIELEERLKRELDDFNNMSEDEFRNLQDRKLRECLLHHFNNEFNDSYRKLLAENGIESEGDLPKSIDEIDRLPIVTKEFLLESDYVSNPCVDKSEIDRIVVTTGSTGKAIEMPHSYKDSIRLYGDLSARILVMNGVPLNIKEYWITHWIPGKIDNSSSHESALMHQQRVGEDNFLDGASAIPLIEHYQKIREEGFDLVGSAPNFFLGLLGLIMTRNLEPLKIRYLLQGGAAISEQDKETVMKGFQAEVFPEMYSSTESFHAAATQGKSQNYHVLGDEHNLEILTEENLPVNRGDKGYVVDTTFRSRTLPIIRYKNTDGANFLGKSDYLDKFDMINNIHRAKEAQIGDGFVPYTDIERVFPSYLKTEGVPVLAIQLARQRNADTLKDIPILRIETPVSDEAKVNVAAQEAFRQNFEMQYLLDDSHEIEPLRVEVYKPGELRKGKFKIELFTSEVING